MTSDNTVGDHQSIMGNGFKYRIHNYQLVGLYQNSNNYKNNT